MSNQEHQLPALRQQKTSNFFQAITARKINEVPEGELRNALRYAMVKIGLRGANFPVGLEKSLLLQHIYENFGDNTPDEIRLAFDWAIDGKLNLEKDEVNCYENFSCAYFSRIMNAYKKLASKVYRPEEFKMLEAAKQEVDFDKDAFFESDFGKRLLRVIPELKDNLKF